MAECLDCPDPVGGCPNRLICREISVGPHAITRTIKGHYDRYHHERTSDITFDEIDVDFPFIARCGSVSAIGKTADGAVGMVEKILRRKGAR